MLKKLRENFDEYNLKARVYPSIIALLPLFVFAFLIFHNSVGINAILSVLSSSAITIIVIYFISDVVRNLGKYMEIKIFSNELNFPTAEILLNTNTHISNEKRDQIYNKIKNDFDFSLFSLEEEKNNEKQARQKIKEATGLIRQKVGNGRLLLQYNIRYGFWRNLIGVSLISQLMSIIAWLFFYINLNLAACFIFVTFFACYLVIFIFKKQLLEFFGYQYAEQLLLEYLSQ